VSSLKPEPSTIKLCAVFPTHQDESKKLFNFMKGPPPDSFAGVHTMQLDQAITEFFNGYFSTHERSKKTQVAYKSDLEQLAAYAPKECSLYSLDAGLIENWAADLRQRSYSPASMRRKMVVLKVFCSYWVRKGVLSESPFWRVKLSFGRTVQLPRALTESEMRDLLAQARQNHFAAEIPRKGSALAKNRVPSASARSYRTLRNFALVDLLFATGMRVGEASSLNLRDFGVAESVFKVRGKGGRDRLAFVVDEQTVQIQRKHIEARSRLASDSPALFLNASGERLSTQGIANIIAQFRKDAGIERHITPHMLRHTVATLLLRNGVDIRIVQEFLGHASIATTQRYTHVTKDHLIRVLRERHPSLSIRTAS
jgi:site-specific recombinase XerD